MKNRVEYYRFVRCWKQSELAACVGVTRECIDAIEKGRFLPSIALAYRIAAAFDQAVQQLFPPQSVLYTPVVQKLVTSIIAARKSSKTGSSLGGSK